MMRACDKSSLIHYSCVLFGLWCSSIPFGNVSAGFKMHVLVFIFFHMFDEVLRSVSPMFSYVGFVSCVQFLISNYN